MRRSKKKTFNKAFVVFITVIFVLSGVGVVIFQRDDNRFNEDRFTLSLGGRDYEFRVSQTAYGYHYDVSSDKDSFSIYTLPGQFPPDLDKNALNRLRTMSYFFLVFSPEDEAISYIDFIRFELRKNMPFDRYFEEFVTMPNPAYNLGIASCENASLRIPVVLLQKSNATEITEVGDCIIIGFPEYDTLRVRDMLVYSMRGIEI